METKTCTICSETKEIELFCTRKNICKECNKAKCKEYRTKNKDKVIKYSREYRSLHKEELAIRVSEWSKNNRDKRRVSDLKYKVNNRDLLSTKSREYYESNKDLVIERQKEHYSENRESIAVRRRIYYINNRENLLKNSKIKRSLNIVSFRLKRNQYAKKLREINENYAIAIKLRVSLNKSLRNQKIKKTFHSGITNNRATEIILHIGPRPEGCYLDHIIPMTAFDLRNKIHREMAMSKYNLRWITAEENLRKNKNVDFNLILAGPELIKIANEIGILTTGEIK